MNLSKENARKNVNTGENEVSQDKLTFPFKSSRFSQSTLVLVPNQITVMKIIGKKYKL